MIRWRHVILIVAITGLTTAVSASYENQTYDQTVLDRTIALNEQGDFQGQFDTLIAAVQNSDASVAETLNDSEANLTVFAPTDDAFSEAGINPDNVGELSEEDLTNVLLNHVSEERLLYEDLTGRDGVETLYGENITLTNEVITDQTGDESSIVVANIEASNGVIHAVDGVVKPYSLG